MTDTPVGLPSYEGKPTTDRGDLLRGWLAGWLGRSPINEGILIAFTFLMKAFSSFFLMKAKSKKVMKMPSSKKQK